MEAKGNLVVFRQASCPGPGVPQDETKHAVGCGRRRLLAMGIAFLVEYLDDTLKTRSR